MFPQEMFQVEDVPHEEISSDSESESNDIVYAHSDNDDSDGTDW